MNQHIEKARKANRAADAIASSMTQTLLDMRPAFAHQFNIDEQLVSLAIAQAAMESPQVPRRRRLEWKKPNAPN